MLELVKVRAIRIFQAELTAPIMIEAAAGMDEAAVQIVLDEKPRKRKMEREEIRSIREPSVRRRWPQSLQRFAKFLDSVDRETIQSILNELQIDLEAQNRGIRCGSRRRLSAAHTEIEC